MAPLPLGRIIAQVIVPLVAVLARAIPAAYSQAIANARKNGVDGSKAATQMITKHLSKSEALQILNIAEKEAVTAEAVERVSGSSIVVWKQEVWMCAARHTHGFIITYYHVLSWANPSIYCTRSLDLLQQFEKYFAANSVENGGSFYIQSKVYRAKEMLEEYLQEQKLNDKKEREEETKDKQ